MEYDEALKRWRGEESILRTAFVSWLRDYANKRDDEIAPNASEVSRLYRVAADLLESVKSERSMDERLNDLYSICSGHECRLSRMEKP